MPKAAEPQLWPAPKRPFPRYWLIGVVSVWLLLQLGLPTRDFRVVATQVCSGVLIAGLLIWYAARGRAKPRTRVAVIASVLLAVFTFFATINLENDGDGRFVGWRFRWQPTPDETLAPPVANRADLLDVTAPEYPAFLGGQPWAQVEGVRLIDDWRSRPPIELWRCDIGAGWSAFAVSQGLAVTQEQRGEQELVVARRVTDGQVVWWHADEARFDPFGPMQAMGGIGPRATPLIFDGHVVTQGATGIVNCLDLASGTQHWSRNLNEEFGVDNLLWGKSSSPMIIADQRAIVIAAGATGDGDEPLVEGKSLVALDLETGEERWSGGGRVTSYASPSLGVLAGRRQVLQVNQHFLTAHDAGNGQVLWEFPWPGSSSTNASSSQAIALPGDRVFVSKGYGVGSALLQIRRAGDAFTAEPIWQRGVMKTKFGNVAIARGHAYGLDGIVLQCVELATGRSVWKKRRRPSFGHGQLMLVGERLLILTELGEVVLADASPNGYEERASIQALDPVQVTWNNPALAGPHLLVRNAREAVCYRLPLQEGDKEDSSQAAAPAVTPERSPAASPPE